MIGPPLLDYLDMCKAHQDENQWKRYKEIGKPMTSQIYIKPECGREDRMGEEIGPFEYVQITYSKLYGPDGEPIAGQLHSDDDEWSLDDKHGDSSQVWSDIVIYAKSDFQAKLDAIIAACEKFSAAHCFPSSNKESAFYAEPPTDAVVDPQDWVEFSEAIKAAKL